MREAKIAGEYTIKEYLAKYNIIIVRNSDGLLVATDFDTISYLTGTHVENPEIWTCIDPERFQPEVSEYCNNDYFTEDESDLGFWYCGWRNDVDRTLSTTLLTGRWCYGRFPWAND